ncbi:MAG TPA: hypothetical protein VN158_09840 [Caulobacter sp.]|nr:hypothetical protein [Caulobacter sp.]
MNFLDVLRGGSEQDRFARRYLGLFRRLGGQGSTTYEPDGFLIRLGGSDGQGTIFLRNVFQDWRKAPLRERDEILRRAAASAVEMRVTEETFEDVRPFLLPVVRNLSHLVTQRLHASPAQPLLDLEGCYSSIADTLAVMIAVDRPNSINIVYGQGLKGWGVTLDEALCVALDNLREISPVRFERQASGFYVSEYGDYHDASRLLLPHLFLSLELKGDPVAVVLSRSGVVVAGSEDRDALEAMAAFVETAMADETRPIAYRPLVLRDGAWTRFDALASPAVTLLQAKQALWDASEQKAVLDSYHERTGRDVYVATLEVLEADGRYPTWAIWTFGVDTLLPCVEVIALNPGDVTAVLPRYWRDVEAICGPFEREPETEPPRYRVCDAPSAEQLARLEAAERPPWFPEPNAGA